MCFRLIFLFPAGGDEGNDTGIPSLNIIAVSIAAILISLLLLVILVCIFKQRKAKRRAAEMTTDDLNPVYGVYFDPDPRMEFEDTNDNYSSDYEPVGTSRTTDNNPYYE